MKENSNDIGLFFAHYGEEREAKFTDEEKQMFDILCGMFKSRGYDPTQLELTHKSDNYASVVIGDYDVARIKYTERAKWITIPYAEPKAEKHHISVPDDIRQFDDLVDRNIAFIEKYAEIKKEGR